MQRITSVRFTRYKGFRDFSLSLDQFNILVGPNNAGKSTVLGAFRVLSEAMRRARTKNAILVVGPNGIMRGHEVNLSEVPIATENVFYDYDESQGAKVVFRVSSGDTMTLYFPEVVILQVTGTLAKVHGNSSFRRWSSSTSRSAFRSAQRSVSISRSMSKAQPEAKP